MNKSGKIRLCIIGYRGHVGYVLKGLPYLLEVELAGISSGCEDPVDKLQNRCEKAGWTPENAYTDSVEMLDREKPDIVCIDGPFDSHASMCVEALDRGIHVFCEKPIALTIEDLGRVRKAHARNSDVQLSSMVGLRYDPAFLCAWRAVQSGAVGKVMLIKAQKSYRLGTRPEFFRHRSTYGGTIPWVGSHAIDWIYWFSDSKFKSVFASQTTDDNARHGDLEVAAQCQFKMANGIQASASIDYLRPPGSRTHGDDRIRVAGTDGVIEVVDGKVTLINAEETRALSTQGETGEEVQIFVDFVRRLQGKSLLTIDAEQTFDVTEACLLARESADTGKLIEFP